MNMIEEWGSGIPKLIREMQEQELQAPEFIDIESAFRVNLYRAVTEKGQKNGVNDTDDPEQVGVDDVDHEPNHEPNEPKHEPDGPDRELDEPKDHSQNRVQTETLEERVLLIIRENGRISIDQLAKDLGISRSTVKRVISKLRQQNRVTRTGSNRSGEWKVL